jgi:V8-like Glu-specific endopeptidase
MDDRARKHRVASSALKAAVFALFGFACSGPPQTATTDDDDRGRARESRPLDPFAPGASVLCGMNEALGGELEPEVYMLSAMNNKLRHYPELGAFIGLDSIVSCEDARRFMTGHAAYLADHPDFDADQPLGAMAPPPEPPPESEHDVETRKILNSETSNINTVVRITFEKADGSPASCSGTFIAKNWILTAAHCVSVAAVDACVRAGIPVEVGQCNPEWFVYNQWTIQHGAFTIPKAWALAYVHPDWLGRNPAMNSDFVTLTPEQRLQTARADLALLYVGDDRRLPPRVEEDGAMRLSLSNPQAAWDFTFYGWGLPTDTLRQSIPGDIHYTVFSDTIRGEALSTTSSATCRGDSGGPLTRVLNVQTRTGTRPVRALVGVASIGLGGDCLSVPEGFPMTWARIDTQLAFIEESLRFWNGPRFECEERSATDDVFDEIAECWGSPCTQDADCGARPAFCSRPGRNFSSCTTCGDSSCGCIVGQCLPGPQGSN